MTRSLVGPFGLPSSRVLGMRVDHIEASTATEIIVGWAAASPAISRVICAANVHMTMQAYDDPSFRAIVNTADLVVPDGVPMVWALRALRLPQRRRVRVTPDLLIDLIAACEAHGIKMGLYGGTPETLTDFVSLLKEAVPDLQTPFRWSPPFRPLTRHEDAEVTEQIDASGVQLLLVGIGCPKQERWMAAHAEQLQCVMFGVGAAFDVFAGATGNAPAWMRDRGLEWIYRLATEPGRLWRRYLLGNPRFVWHFALQIARGRTSVSLDGAFPRVTQREVTETDTGNLRLHEPRLPGRRSRRSEVSPGTAISKHIKRHLPVWSWWICEKPRRRRSCDTIVPAVRLRNQRTHGNP